MKILQDTVRSLTNENAKLRDQVEKLSLVRVDKILSDTVCDQQQELEYRDHDAAAKELDYLQLLTIVIHVRYLIENKCLHDPEGSASEWLRMGRLLKSAEHLTQ